MLHRLVKQGRKKKSDPDLIDASTYPLGGEIEGDT
jgi:hypothetical protein